MRSRAEAICTHTLADIRAVPPPTGSGDSLAAYLRKVRPIVASEATQMAALPRPAHGRATLGRFIAAVSEAARDYRRAAADASAGNRRAAAADLSDLRTVPVARLAGAYGLRACTGTVATSG